MNYSRVTGDWYNSADSEEQDDSESECRAAVAAELAVLLRPYGSPTRFHRELSDSLGGVISLAAEDLVALTASDPASRGSWKYVLDSYAAYRAVLSHRLAHAVQRMADRVGDTVHQSDLLAVARSISESAKIATGVEIHPSATIGRRLVLDHATGSVVGETAVLGDDCYILQGVVLGAFGIAGNPTGKRHPTLGDRVEIGSYARVLGPVVVGSDTLISPHALVLTDIPAGSRVRLMNQCQIQTRTDCSTVLAVVPAGPSELQIHGSDLAGGTVDFVKSDGSVADDLPVRVAASDFSRIDCRILGSKLPTDEILRITGPGGNQILLTQMDATWSRLSSLSLELMPSSS